MARLNYKEVLKGDVGATYEPHLTDESVLYWTNNGGLENPTPKNIRGETGLTPNLQIGTVETLESNLNASVEITGTRENPIINFGIPKGKEQDITLLNDKTGNIITIQNLLNNESFVEGGLNSDGTVSNFLSNYCSDYIEVEPLKKYFRLNKNLMLISFYDENKNHIFRKDINGNSFTTPLNTKYIRCTDTKEILLKEVISTDIVETYTPYQVKPSYILNNTVVKNLNRMNLSDGFLSNSEFMHNVDLNLLNTGGSFVCINSVNSPCDNTILLFNIPFIDSNKIRWSVQFAIDLINGNLYTRKVDISNQINNTKWVNHIETTLKDINKLKEKTWVFFGDSITEGVGTKNPSLESYPARIRDKYSINIINKAIAGASWQEDGQYDNICVLTQIKNTDLNNVDFCTIFAGTNDFGRGALPIGNIDDTCTNTLHGAINNAIKMIIEKKQDIKIGIITPMWRQRLSADDNKDSDFNDINGKYLRDYVNAVIESAKYNHVPVLNMYENCGINKYNQNVFLSDGLHPNDKGYDEILSEKIYNFMLNSY